MFAAQLQHISHKTPKSVNQRNKSRKVLPHPQRLSPYGVNDTGINRTGSTMPIQRTKAGFLVQLNNHIWNLESGTVNYNHATRTLTVTPVPATRDDDRLKMLAHLWREVTNLYFDNKADWGGADEKVSVYFKTTLYNDMVYEQEAVYSLSQEGYINKESKTSGVTTIKDFIEHYEGEDPAGHLRGEKFSAAHKDTGFASWHEKIAIFAKSGDTGSKSTAEAGRFQAIYNLNQPTDDTVITVMPSRAVENVVSNAAIISSPHTVTAIGLTQSYDTICNIRYLTQLKKDIIAKASNFLNLSGLIRNGLQLHAATEAQKRLSPKHFAGSRDVFNAAKNIVDLLPANVEDAKRKRQEGTYRKLPIKDDELIDAIENYNLGPSSQILTDKAGKGLSLTEVHGVLS